MDFILDFAERFGFTPLDRAKLFRDHRALPGPRRPRCSDHKPLGEGPTKRLPPRKCDALGAWTCLRFSAALGLPN
jgi:hypothetical protein